MATNLNKLYYYYYHVFDDGVHHFRFDSRFTGKANQPHVYYATCSSSAPLYIADDFLLSPSF